MKALIIASGRIDDYDLLNSLVQENSFILCADGGLNHLMKIGLIPNLVLGDLDSISDDGIEYIKSKNIKVEKYPTMKDETDTHLAVNYLISKNYKEITIIGGIGTRMDHTLANIFLLRKLNKIGIKGCIINGNNIIHLIDNSIKLLRKDNYYTSIIPISQDGIQVSVSGFLYPLMNEHIEFGSTRGISNILTSSFGNIILLKGEALIIESMDL